MWLLNNTITLWICMHCMHMPTNQVCSSSLYILVVTTCSPLRFMVLRWSGSVPTPSWHTTRVPLRSAVALTVAVDVMDVPGITSVTLNVNGGWSVITLPWSRRRRDREMPRDWMFHWCPRDGIVQMKVTVFPGHGLSTLDCNWAPETENKQSLDEVA